MTVWIIMSIPELMHMKTLMSEVQSFMDIENYKITTSDCRSFIYGLMSKYSLKDAFLLTHPHYPQHLCAFQLHILANNAEKFANKTCTPRNSWAIFDEIYYMVEFAYLMGAKDKIMTIIEGNYQTLVVKPYQKMNAIFDVGRAIEHAVLIENPYLDVVYKWSNLAARVAKEMAEALAPTASKAILVVNQYHPELHRMLPYQLLQNKLDNIFNEDY